MAVKVRCPTCEKVLNAPDAARGKAVKCPACETKVKVPADESSGSGSSTTRRSAKAPAKKRAEVDDDEFLAGLDLDKVIDTSSQMCPKCGANIPEDATECPKCGVDPTTGQLSAAAKKRSSRKGLDPALFYSAAWKDSWAFTMENKSVAIRTALYFILLSAVSYGCSFMVGWSSNLPPKFFWAAMYFVTNFVPIGWIWCLTIETIRATVARKTSIRQVHFDIYQNVALGIKFYLWLIVFGWFPPALVMYPLAMIHMAMPVTKRAWLNFLMASTFFRNFMPTMYYWVIWLATRLVLGVLVGVTLFFSLATVIGLVTAMRQGGAKPDTTALVLAISAVSVVGILSIFLYSFMVIFNARVIGLLAYYFKDTLDLVVVVAEKTYVHKEVKLDRYGNPIKSGADIAKQVAFIVGIFALVGVAAFFIWYQLFKKS
jgi:ribosomal protein L40E